MKDRLKVSIIGTGNVGQHLAVALAEAVDLQFLYTRDKSTHQYKEEKLSCRITSNLSDLDGSQVIIICIPDQAIPALARKLKDKISGDPLIVHCAGSVGSNVLAVASDNYGVFYPLQTFTKDFPLDMSKVPILVTANNKNGLKILLKLGDFISDRVEETSDEDRRHLHLAAVIGNNFTNHLLYQCQQYLADKNLDYTLILPLLEETIRKATVLSPYEAQTGPARRQDKDVIKAHLKALEENPAMQSLYDHFSKLIMSTYENRR